MSTRIRLGILGCGDIAHQCYIPVLQKSSRAQITVVCDVIEERARDTAHTFGIAAYATDYATMLRRDDVDAVVVLSQGPQHGEHCLMALRAGKHVCTEKPMANSVEQATEIIETARARDLKVTAAPAVVKRPTYIHLRRLLDHKAIGKVCWARIHSVGHGPVNYLGYTTDPRWFYQKGVGPLRDSGVYALHTITGLLGPVRRVSAMSALAVSELTVRVGPARGQTFAVTEPDIVLLLMEFASGALGLLDATYVGAGAGGPGLEIFGSDGTLTQEGQDIKLFRDDHELMVRGWQTAYAAQKPPDWNYAYCALDLIDAIVDNRAPVVSAEHARHVIDIMESAFVAARTGQTQELTTVF